MIIFIVAEPIPKLQTLQVELDMLILSCDTLYYSADSFDLYINKKSNNNEVEQVVKTTINVANLKEITPVWLKNDFDEAYKLLLGEENFLKVKDYLKSYVIEGEFDQPQISEIIITIVE